MFTTTTKACCREGIMFTVVARQPTTTEAGACHTAHINQYVNDSTLSILTVSIDRHRATADNLGSVRSL